MQIMLCVSFLPFRQILKQTEKAVLDTNRAQLFRQS